jgi:hypothetical protein
VAVAVFLAWLICGLVYGDWQNYWLLKDGQLGTATVTRRPTLEHGQVRYRYKVNGRVYLGSSHLPGNQETRRFPFESTVYFSASHPWISRLYMPRSFIEGLPGLILVLPFELIAMFLILRPKPKVRTIVIHMGPSSEITEDDILDRIFPPGDKGDSK